MPASRRLPLVAVPSVVAAVAGGILLVLLSSLPSRALATPEPLPAADGARLRLALEKLAVTGSALYVAAHPDDENTAFLTWLANGRKVRTAYLSLTRGDGGQNLIGSDTGVLLGVLRTQELLAARRIDGARQYFTRALDFGFSKGPEETLEIWGRERILADVVWVIRSFQPDVIVTRFPVDGQGGHGHHTASAILAEEAFMAAADPSRFPEQLTLVKPWQARRIVWNVFRPANAPRDTAPNRVRVDVGAYDPLLGRSYTELAGESRSQHRTQGFGSAERRGTFENSFEHRAGERATTDLFDGVDPTWSRHPGGARFSSLVRQALKEFRPEKPAEIVPVLFRAREAIAKLPADATVTAKREELDFVIRSCLGLWIEAIATAPSATPGGTARIVTSALDRSGSGITLESVEIVGDGGAAPHADARRLGANQAVTDTFRLAVPGDSPIARPYWLEEPPLAGSFEVGDQAWIGVPENPPIRSARFRFDVAGHEIAFETPVVHRWVDPVQGERYRDFQIVPPATLGFDRDVYLFPDTKSRRVGVVVRAADRALAGTVKLEVSPGWSASPVEAAVALGAARSDTTVWFQVVPPAGGPSSGAESARLSAAILVDGRSYGFRATTLDYPHLPLQELALPAEAHLVRADMRVAEGRVGYVMGSGDAVPDALREMGLPVTELSDEDLESADLSAYDTIVTGVRAYNTRPRLLSRQKRLLDYVARGGRLVVQYNTAEEALQNRLGPKPFRISRDRVTVEGAPATFLAPGHPLLTTPNRISASDFEGWVQERGLYFANPWDASYDSVLAMNDPGEPARAGGLLYARHGEGVFIYTGLSWFRQLPAGVPGAYRLFANLVSPTRRRL